MDTPSWMRPEEVEKLRHEEEKARRQKEEYNSPEARAERARKAAAEEAKINARFEHAIRADSAAKAMLRDTADMLRSHRVSRLEIGAIRDGGSWSGTPRMKLTLYDDGLLKVRRVNTIQIEPTYLATWDASLIVRYERYPVGRKASDPLFLLSCGYAYGLGHHNKSSFTYGGDIDKDLEAHCEACAPGVPRITPFSTDRVPERHDCLLSTALTLACFKAGIIN